MIKKKEIGRLKFLIAAVALIVTLTTGCTSGSFIRINAVEKNTSNSISMSYDKFSGHKSTTIKLAEGEVLEVKADIKSTDGELDFLIIDENDENVYQGIKLPTSSFVVKLDKEGRYILKVSGRNHKGSYYISWERSEPGN